MVRWKKKAGEGKDIKELQETIAVLKVVAMNLRNTADEFEHQIEELKELNKASSAEGK